MSAPDEAVPEFTFELRVCRWAERRWPPGRDRTSELVVARQLGVRSRRWDTVIIECDPVGLRERLRFGTDAFDADALAILRHAPAEWAYYREVLPEPDYPWRYVRESIHELAERDALATRRRGGRIEIRRVRPYPDWVERVVTVENKPDLTASAARDLVEQLQRDVALGLADETWVATRATDRRVEPVLLERLPVEAGVLAVDTDGTTTATPVWLPRRLAVDAPGTRVLERGSGPNDRGAARFAYVDPDWKHRKRLALAERALERGWRAYAATMRTDCRHFRLAEPAPGEWVPVCEAKAERRTATESRDDGALSDGAGQGQEQEQGRGEGRPQTPNECATSCPHFEPEPPTWRTRGWPIEGGPGRAVTRVLARQRDRTRPTPDSDANDDAA